MAMWKQNHTVIVLNNTARRAREYILIFVICATFLFVWKCSQGRGKVSAFTGSCLANVTEGRIQTEINRPTKSLSPLLCPCEPWGCFASFKWESGYCLSLHCLGTRPHPPTAQAWLLLPWGRLGGIPQTKGNLAGTALHPRGLICPLVPGYPSELSASSSLSIGSTTISWIRVSLQTWPSYILVQASCTSLWQVASTLEIPFLHLSSEGNDIQQKFWVSNEVMHGKGLSSYKELGLNK